MKKYLTYHGRSVEAAEWVVRNFYDTVGYHNNTSVRQWVDGSLEVLNEAKSNGV